jgi:hypothetical protein
MIITGSEKRSRKSWVPPATLLPGGEIVSTAGAWYRERRRYRTSGEKMPLLRLACYENNRPRQQILVRQRTKSRLQPVPDIPH